MKIEKRTEKVQCKCDVDVGRQLAMPFGGDSHSRRKIVDGGHHSVTIPCRNGTKIFCTEHGIYDPMRVNSVARLALTDQKTQNKLIVRM